MLHAKSIITLFVLALSGTSLAAGSGDHDHHGQHHGSGNGQTVYGQPGDPKKVTRIIKVSGEEFSYSPATFSVKKGEVIKFIFSNKGAEDHELTIGDQEMQLAHRKMMAEMANDPKMKGHDHSAMKNVVTAKPGETKELVWHFTQTGDFSMACNIPGHAESGMEAKISVK